MARSRVGALLVVFTLSAAGAEAQVAPFTGMLTGHVGAVARGDVRGVAVAPGGSMAVIGETGLGVEFDVSHNGDFDDTNFADSSITPVMLNFMAVYQHPTFRPFMTAGAGVLRLRVAYFDGQSSIGHTDLAWSAGGGLVYMLDEGFGVRGDVRYFRHFNRQHGFALGDNGVLDFIRTSIGITYTWPMQ